MSFNLYLKAKREQDNKSPKITEEFELFQTPTEITLQITDGDSLKCEVDKNGVPIPYKEYFYQLWCKGKKDESYKANRKLYDSHLASLTNFLQEKKAQGFTFSWYFL
jgi:hypothetical protein